MGPEKISTTKRYIFVSENELREAQSATWLGRNNKEAKRIEKLNREKQDLLGMVDDLIRQNELLLERLRRLKV